MTDLDDISAVAGNVMKAVCKEILQPVEKMLVDLHLTAPALSHEEMYQELGQIIQKVKKMQL